MKKSFGLTFIALSTLLLNTEVFAGVEERVQAHQQNVMSESHHQEHYKRKHGVKTDHIVPTKPAKKISGHVSGAARSVTRVVITGNKSISSDALKSIISPYLAGSVSAKKASQIKTAVEDYYKKEGYLLPIADVQVAKGVVSVKMIEGSIKDVTILLEDKTLTKQAITNSHLYKLIEDIENTPAIKTKQLERYLLLIEKIHGFKIDYEIDPLAEPVGDDVAGIIIKVYKERGKASVSIDNNGVSELGKHEFMANAQAYNVIANDSLMVSGGTSDKINRFQMGSVGYLKRLTPYGTSLSVSGSYFKDDPYAAPGSKDSESKSAYVRLDQYLALNNNYSVKLELKAEQMNKIQYAAQSKQRDYKYYIGAVGGKIKIDDFFGAENWFYPYYHWTLNDVTYSKSSAVTAPNFDKNFNYFLVDWYRTQFIGEHFSFMIHGSYQTTNKDLPSEHLYSLGSYHTIKGYVPGVVSGDEGVTGNLELRYSHNFKGNISKAVETAQLFGFYGATQFINHNKDLNRRAHPDNMCFDKSVFQSMGAGVRVYFPYQFYGEFTAAFPLTKNVKIDGAAHKNKPQYNFLISKDFKW